MRVNGSSKISNIDPSRSPKHLAITGATGGLGYALAEFYAQPGRMLSLSGRDAARLDQVAIACRAKGAEVNTHRCDVTDAEAMALWLEQRDAALPVDILIANAGMGGGAVMAPRSGETGAQAREILMTNTMGVVNTVTPILPHMVARGRGHVVLVASIQAMVGMPQSPVYCASKAAVRIYGDGLRRLMRQHGVRVTNVLPGFVDTPMSQSLDLARPWCWPADKAARRIARDVARGAAQSIFPWPLRLSIGLQNVMPVAATDYVMAMIARAFPVPEDEPASR